MLTKDNPLTQAIDESSPLSGDGDSKHDASQSHDGTSETKLLGLEKKAFNELLDKAQKGDKESQFELGIAYYSGEGTQRNLEEAVKWFMLATEKGDVFAPFVLWLAYLNGKGVQQNFEEALKWLHLAAERDDKMATFVQFILDSEREMGSGKDISQHEEEALKWYQDIVDKYDGKINLYDPSTNFDHCGALAIAVQSRIAVIKERAVARTHRLEKLMSLFVHKFRGLIGTLKSNVKHRNDPQLALHFTNLASTLLDTWNTITTNAEVLRARVREDQYGQGTLFGILKNAWIMALSQVLTVERQGTIRQHYLVYAKRQQWVPADLSYRAWRDDHFELEAKLQQEWENSFTQLHQTSDFSWEILQVWISEHFFSVRVEGFDDSKVKAFAEYGPTATVLLIISSELILNILKYYAPETQQPVHLTWKLDGDFFYFRFENPSSRTERARRVDKNSTGNGHEYLQILAEKLEGVFPKPALENWYVTQFRLPSALFAKEET